MKVNGFLKDVLGANRVTKARRDLIASGSEKNIYSDPIRRLTLELHPETTHVKVVKVADVSPTARKFTFEADKGDVLPPFQAGQYVSLDLKIGDTVTTRPYSISSAPYEARTGEHPFFEITVRNGKPGVGFASSWIYANVKEGDTFTAHLPFGEFKYEPLRDSAHIVALAGGSGITPFYAMAKEIEHGTMDADLTILYGSVSTKDIILEKELNAIKSPRVRFINVISGEEDYEGEKGFLSAEIIKKYSAKDSTYFVCGPLPMYNFVAGELKKLNIPAKRIRMEVFGAPVDITKAEGYPAGKEEAVYNLTVYRGIDKTVIPASGKESLAVAMERAGIPNNTRCRSGACGYCRCELLSGDVFVPSVGDGRRRADKKFGFCHACSTYPLSDLEIRIIIK
ncbi:MAG: iron-sulfur cluster-binding domain-containing protein [Erysipelotrichales bacterium]|nr:iron-sulfur cluster-binding domain-containing protein [Erysipelotrichales bacterium]